MEAMDFSKFRDTGELSDITISVGGNDFFLHKFPLYIKSDYFKNLAKDGGDKNKIDLKDFPGSYQTFSLVADFCYNMRVDISVENVVKLRCAAEYLKMDGKGNLSDLCDRYLQDILTSSKFSRSFNMIVDLLMQCCTIGDVADHAKITTCCLESIIAIWLKPPTKFSTPTKKAHDKDVKDDEVNLERLCQLPIDLFHKLIVLARDRVVWPKTLAIVVQKYTSKFLFPEANYDDSIHKPSASPIPTVTVADADVDKVPAKESDAEEKPKKEANDDKTKTDAKADDPKVKQDRKDENKITETEIGIILDTLMMELPDDTPFEETASPAWILRALGVADKLNCKCRPRLVQLASETFHRFTPEDMEGLTASLICEIVENACKLDSCVPEVVCKVIDNYMLDLAKKKKLTVDIFSKLSKSLPKDFRPTHDTLFEVLEVLLKSENLPEEKRNELLEGVDFKKLGEDTLTRAYDSELIPPAYITKAALDLCSKLRAELESAKAIIKMQDDDIQRILKAKSIANGSSSSRYWESPRSRYQSGDSASSSYLKPRKDELTPSWRPNDVGRTGEDLYPSMDDLRQDYSRVTDYSTSGYNADDVKDVLNGLGELTPRYMNSYSSSRSKHDIK